MPSPSSTLGNRCQRGELLSGRISLQMDASLCLLLAFYHIGRFEAHGALRMAKVQDTS